MSKFKVGDVVVLKEDYQGVPAGTTLTITRGAAALYESSGLWWTKEMPRGVYGYRLELYSHPADDLLPPAPKSVRYNDDYPDRTAYKQTWLDIKRRTHRIYLESGQYGTGHGVGMEITPDAALQLAHDLTRMAMEIRRKERNGN